MNLTINHLYNMEISSFSMKKHRELSKYVEPKNRIKNKLIISNILPGSYIKTVENLHAGDTINKIDGQIVNDLDQFRNLITLKLL